MSEEEKKDDVPTLNPEGETEEETKDDVDAPEEGRLDLLAEIRNLGPAGQVFSACCLAVSVLCLLPWVYVEGWGNVAGVGFYLGLFIFLFALAGVPAPFLIFKIGPQKQRKLLTFAALAAPVVILVLSLVLITRSTEKFPIGVPAILVIPAAIGMAVGAFLIAREEKLF